jgi:hypothetical protein
MEKNSKERLTSISGAYICRLDTEFFNKIY